MISRLGCDPMRGDLRVLMAEFIGVCMRYGWLCVAVESAVEIRIAGNPGRVGQSSDNDSACVESWK
jgi:hypothetical protein